ncbi:MAG: LicD family protein [Pseudoxanthomonas sp.]|nr:LicD family protein [Pseudoxanthomonas sp.]
MRWQELFPGLPHFGQSPYDRLQLAVPVGSNAVRFIVQAPDAEILNLRAVRLIDDQGELVDLGEIKAAATVSSSFGDEADAHGAPSLLRGRGIHTKREFAPNACIEWTAGNRRIAVLEILNRGDEFGARSNHLVIDARKDGKWTRIFQNDGANRLLDIMSRASRHLDPRDFVSALAARELPEYRLRLMAHVIASVSQDAKRHLPGLDWLYALVNPSREHATDSDVEVLSVYYASQILKGAHLGSIPLAGHVLTTRSRIESSERLINTLLAAAGRKESYLYTRHGLQLSQLRSAAGEYLALARRVIESLARRDCRAFICYGTLLGAVRTGDFIAHDDDLDVVFLEDGASSARDEVIRHLESEGFQVREDIPLLNVRVSIPGSHIFIDLFPAWPRADGLHMYMEKMRIRAVPVEAVLPLGTVHLRGEAFPAPGHPDQFLTERYGADWMTEARFFEWPYKIDG